MPAHIEAIRRRLEGIIAEAESHMSANGSILSYGMKIRRDTAEEILDFVKSLARAPESGAPGGDRGFGPVETEASSALQDMQKRNAERVGAQSISRPLTGGAALP